MPLVKPFGFLGTAAAGEFDPTLGGTLTIHYHYDFSVDTDMVLDGSNNLVSIAPKVKHASETGDALLSINNAASNYYTSASFDESLGLTIFSQSNYNSGSDTTDWIPEGMLNNEDWTLVLIASHSDWQGYTNEKPLWGITSYQTNGYNNIFGGVGSSFFTTCSGSGLPNHGFARYNGSWAKVGQASNNTDPGAYKDLGSATYVYGYNGAGGSGGTNYYHYTVNNFESCSFNANGHGPFYGVPENGFQVGAQRNVTNTAFLYGGLYHVVLYDGVLTQDQINSLYDEWYSVASV